MEMISEPLKVEAICEGGQGRKEVLIKWKDLSYYEAIWELYYVIKK